MIATDRTLGEIAIRKPASVLDLHEIHGMGPARVAKYGEALLRIVRETTS